MNIFRFFDVILIFVAHRCKFPGCGSVFVLDGNMKNRRDVCYAKDAGFIQFDGLPGLIKTGCTSTPAFKSHYCSHHGNPICPTVDHGIGQTDRICMA